VFKFITDKPFWVNLLVTILLAVALIYGILQMLGVITKHGQYLTVPNVVGKNTVKAIKLLEEQGFEVIIQDSIYTDTAQKGVVLKQLPDPNNTVKINRTILLTVNRVTLPLIDMPALEGKTLNFALTILKRSHLILGDTIYRPDFMSGSVLEQVFNGTRIKPGAKIPWGSAVDLYIGSGLNEEPILVPDLIGKTFDEAKMMLQENGLLLGALVTEGTISDTPAAFIWKQSPPKFNDLNEPVFIKPGQLMDLWISPEMKIDSTK
jgi:beta-lactam-binding protein with PASTA domain